jgi:5-methylthioadenosine/S-adenosylhomocysteine deaminase
MTERILIRGGFVLSQDPEIGEIPGGDVLIEGDKIVQVGRGLSAEDAQVIDATGDMVIPGFIDSHRHTWETSIRTCAPDYTLGAYFGAILD